MAIAAMHAFPHAVLAVLGALLGVEEQGDQTVDIGVNAQDDMAAAPAIAAIGTALGDIFFTTEAQAPVSAVSAGGMNHDRIHKLACFHGVSCSAKTKAAPEGRGLFNTDLASITLTPWPPP